jgi:glycerophosphoryl diester phosphodiesterase
MAIRSPQTPPFEEKESSPLIIAHRGASGLAPENTLAAFRLAMTQGAHGVELDLQLSADGEPVVIHDKRVDRTTSGAGLVQNFRADELGRLDAGSWFRRRLAVRPRLRAMARRIAMEAGNLQFDFSGETVPTLAEVLALMSPLKPRRVYLELKSEPARRQMLLDLTISLVRSSGLAGSVTLLSFDHEAMRLAKEIAPDLRTAATFPIGSRALPTARAIIEEADSARADEVALHFGLASRRTIKSLHESGLAVSAWTVNSRMVMRKLIASGVDSIMTNFPNRLIDAIQSASRRRFVLRRNGGTCPDLRNHR